MSVGYDGQIETEEGDWRDEQDWRDDDDDLDTCGHCGTELSDGWCPTCCEMAD